MAFKIFLLDSAAKENNPWKWETGPITLGNMVWEGLSEEWTLKDQRLRRSQSCGKSRVIMAEGTAIGYEVEAGAAC